MNVLIDTNVLLDILLRREPYYENAARISILSEKGYFCCYISASAVTDIFYIAKKNLKNKDCAVNLIKNILQTVRIASVTESGIREALNLNWNDFEDCVQYIAGQSVSAEYIITRNPRDFTNSCIKILSPEAFLDSLCSG